MSHPSTSGVDDVRRYSFLHLFAHDGMITDAEIDFIEKLIMRDGMVDEDEVIVLDQITRRVSSDRVSAEKWKRICEFRKAFKLEPLAGAVE